MQLLSFLVFLAIFFFKRLLSQQLVPSCDNLGVHIYQELGCSSKGLDINKRCPVAYTCPEYRVPEGKCLFRGRELNNGDIADGSYCRKGCVCQTSRGEKGKYWCGLIIDCFFGPMDPGCYLSKELGKCCGKPTCPPYTTVTCKVDGTEYREGEPFSPKGTCFDCVCKAGFSPGKFELPHCKRRPCDLELRYSQQLEKRCAPLYQGPTTGNNALCCPNGFICDENATIKNEKLSKVRSKERCEFGRRTFGVGDQFDVDYIEYQIKKSANCECRVPPLISCTRT